jgi:tetratricopeptide (TPR) repeat protein
MDLAHQCAIEARKYWERAEREKSTCYADRLLGLLALSDRRLDEAAALLNTAIDSYRRSRTEEQLSSLQNFEESLGDLARAMNDLPLAAQWYQRAVNNAQKWNDLPYQAFSLIKLGEVMLISADLASAQKCFLEGLSAARECGRVDAIAYALYDIAIIQDRQGQRQSAQSNADQALDLFRRLGMKREQTEAEALLARLAEGSQSS